MNDTALMFDIIQKVFEISLVVGIGLTVVMVKRKKKNDR